MRLTSRCFASFRAARLRLPARSGIYPQEREDKRREPELPVLEEFALIEHDNGGTREDPTVGVFWDADRPNLWRVGIMPDPRFLSAPAARKPERIR